MNLKEKSCEVQFPTLQLEDTRHDKNLTCTIKMCSAYI